jgi:hypothetical protein
LISSKAFVLAIVPPNIDLNRYIMYTTRQFFEVKNS